MPVVPGPVKPSSRSRFVTKVPLPGWRIISCSRCRDERACLTVLRLTPNSRLRSPSPGSDTSGEYSPDRMRFRMTFSIWKYSGMLPRAMFGVLRSPPPAGGPARRTPRIRFLRAICSYVHTIEQMSCQAEILRSPEAVGLFFWWDRTTQKGQRPGSSTPCLTVVVTRIPGALDS